MVNFVNLRILGLANFNKQLATLSKTLELRSSKLNVILEERRRPTLLKRLKVCVFLLTKRSAGLVAKSVKSTIS